MGGEGVAELENRAVGRLLVRWHKLISTPKGIAVYNTGENWLYSEGAEGWYWLHWCWFVFIATFTCCRLILVECSRHHISAVVAIAVTITPQSIFEASTTAAITALTIALNTRLIAF